ncbi:hypothetical protein EGW08_003260, partial [Elysia chlorotica]
HLDELTVVPVESCLPLRRSLHEIFSQVVPEPSPHDLGHSHYSWDRRISLPPVSLHHDVVETGQSVLQLHLAEPVESDGEQPQGAAHELQAKLGLQALEEGADGRPHRARQRKVLDLCVGRPGHGFVHQQLQVERVWRLLEGI